MPSPSRTERGLPPLGLLGWPLLAIRTILIVGWLIVCVGLHLLTHRFVRRPRWPARFLRGALAIIGARLRILGKPLQQDVLLLANHQSWLDIMALGAASRARFLSKAEIGDVPLVGWLATLNETIFVSREQKLAIAKQIEDLRVALADGRPFALFPEGTTLGGTDLLPFKPALLKVLEPPPPGLMVQPVYIDFGPETDALIWGTESGTYNAVRIAGRTRGFDLTLHYLEPVDPAAHPHRKAIAAAVHTELMEARAGIPHLSPVPPTDYRPAA